MQLLLLLNQQEELTTFFNLFILQNLGRGLGMLEAFLVAGRSWLGIFSPVLLDEKSVERKASNVHVSKALLLEIRKSL